MEPDEYYLKNAALKTSLFLKNEIRSLKTKSVSAEKKMIRLAAIFESDNWSGIDELIRDMVFWVQAFFCFFNFFFFFFFFFPGGGGGAP